MYILSVNDPDWTVQISTSDPGFSVPTPGVGKTYRYQLTVVDSRGVRATSENQLLITGGNGSSANTGLSEGGGGSAWLALLLSGIRLQSTRKERTKT